VVVVDLHAALGLDSREAGRSCWTLTTRRPRRPCSCSVAATSAAVATTPHSSTGSTAEALGGGISRVTIHVATIRALADSDIQYTRGPGRRSNAYARANWNAQEEETDLVSQAI
jgi:hypothetical protein